MSDRLPVELMKAANGAAKILHQETGAPFVLVILAGDPGQASLVGAWAPGLEEIKRILRELLARCEAGKVKVVDQTGGNRGA